MVGSPETMIRRIRTLHERCGIGHLLMMNQAGAMPTTTCDAAWSFSRACIPPSAGWAKGRQEATI